MTTQELLDEVKRRVEVRRQAGQYPPGLERQLDAEFKAILDVVHRHGDTLGEVDAILDQLGHQLELLESDPPTDSRTVVGRFFHSVSVRLFGRAVRDTRQSVRTALALNMQALGLMREQLRQQRDDDARILNQIEHAVMDRLLMVDVLSEAVLELERKTSQGITRG